MDGLRRARNPNGFPQFRQGHVWLIVHQLHKPPLMLRRYLGLGPGVPVPGGDIPRAPALLQ